MIKFLNEADDMEMDVQVGPEDEIEVGLNDKPNPVEFAKMNPDTIPVAAVKCKDGLCEYYVEADDVEYYCALTEKSLLEGLNDVIECHEDCDICADNLHVVVSENSMGYVRSLEENGASCLMFMTESDAIEMDIQVGPNDEEIRVEENPQEANPVDAVKRQYDSVVIAQNDKNFFMDVEDVQKCADAKCESVLDTLNGIIGIHEDSEIDASNIVLIVNENTDVDLLHMFDEAGVMYDFF